MDLADAIDRETAWLNVPGTDTLPNLVANADGSPGGGPFDSITAYYPRTPYMERRTIYVLRQRVDHLRFAARRTKNIYPFRLILWWPILNLDGSAEEDARAFDAAISLLVRRIESFMGDKTHGGRFANAAQTDMAIQVDYTDPEQTVQQFNGLRAEVHYQIEDDEIDV